jgi:hypothetical protein
MAKACKTRRVVIKKKHGHKLKTPITFMGRTGSGCPKPKRNTGHLRDYKAMFKVEAKACARSKAVRTRGKFSRKAFNNCIKQGMNASIKRH